MSERVGDMHYTGGFVAAVATMGITYASGLLVKLSGALGEAWAHVTPGQAALFIGLLTYGTHNVPKLFRAAAALRARRMRQAGE